MDTCDYYNIKKREFSFLGRLKILFAKLKLNLPDMILEERVSQSIYLSSLYNVNVTYVCVCVFAFSNSNERHTPRTCEICGGVVFCLFLIRSTLYKMNDRMMYVFVFRCNYFLLMRPHTFEVNLLLTQSNNFKSVCAIVFN